MRLFRALPLIVLALTACSNWTDRVVGPDKVSPPSQVQSAVSPQDVRDRFIVVFRDNVSDVNGLTDQLAREAGASVHYRYSYALKGFAATIPAAAVNGLRNNPNVSFVEPDGIVTTMAGGTDNTVSSWGLDRIDQRDLPLSNSYQWTHDGAGVRAYILDTGILTAHNDFGGRASVGYDAYGGSGQDCHGHGTHVAGTVGGGEYGVARATNLVAVRVLDCAGSGTWAAVIAGVDWVRNNAVKPAVANMSLGGGFNSALNTAVANAIASGVTFAIAAGNSSADACSFSPAATPTALTVGATGSTDARASYSNFGTCVDLFAPGSSITSAWFTSTTATNTISGTSMASPHVAGVAAIYLSAHTTATPAQVEAALEGAATPNKVTNPGTGSPNLLLYSLVNSSGGGGFSLSANAYKVKGLQKVDLSWSGATTSVDIYRNGTLIVASTPNDNFHTDNIDVRGGGSYTYRVCLAGTQTCSNNAVANF